MGAVFWSVVVVGAFFVWIVSAFIWLPDRPAIPTWQPRNPRLFLLALIIAALGFGIRYLFPPPEEIKNWLLKFLVDLAPEMVGMAFTVVVIDELNQQLADWQEKERIIRQMGSHSNDFALEAVRQITDKKWHLDGSLCRRNFAGANLQGADLSFANLQEANLQDANLQGAVLNDANLQGVYLAEADLRGAHLFRANLQKAKLWEADLPKALLIHAKLQEADLRAANLQQAGLQYAYLQDANLQEADLQGANLRGTDLSRANLRYAELQGADLDMTTLTEVNVQNACYSLVTYRPPVGFLRTYWPEGFDPKAAGAILVQWDTEKQSWVPAESAANH